MRTLEKSDSSLIAGMQIYHNYVKPHMGLKGKTSAEAAGISVKGGDKWLTSHTKRGETIDRSYTTSIYCN
jgi:hypothetical protein